MKLGWRQLLPTSAFSRVIWGLILGIFVGVFFGEPAGRLKIFGDAYVRLLQMTVVPYVFVSLINGLGRLEADHAARLGKHGGTLILFLWILTLLTLVALPFGYPDWEAGSFFSTTLISERQQFDPLLLYIPANPFYSLSNTILPAVVVFSILVGIALIAVPNKDGLLRGLDNLSQTLMRITNWVVRLTPYGIFAIAASAAGTLRPEALGKLQIYLWIYLGVWLILTFLVLPMLVARSTVIPFRQVLRRARTAMVTAIATGSVLVVLPMIANSCKELLRQQNLDSPDGRATIDVLAPTAYSFPSAGTLLGLGFILFAAWYTGSPLGAEQYPQFLVMGMLSAFGTMVVALPFLLDMFKLPADLFQLYLLGGVVTGRLATGLAAMHGIVICLLGAAAISGALSWRRLIQVAAAGLAITFLAMILLGFALTKAIPYEYRGEDMFVSMQIPPPTAEVVGNDEQMPPPLSAQESRRDRLAVIRQRGTLRIGYLPDTLPFAYRNKFGEIVGFDMEIIHALASDLQLALRIVRIDREDIDSALAAGTVDLVVGGIAITPDSALDRAFSAPYSHHTAGFLVRDHDRSRFSSLPKLRAQADLTIAIPATRYFQEPISQWLPDAKLVPIDTPRPFLRGELPEVDGILGSAEAAGAWSLIYPQFSVTVPEGLSARYPMAFAVPRGQPDWLNFVDSWVALASSSGVVDRAFSRWILGRSPETEKPRWSILSDVLGWGRAESE